MIELPTCRWREEKTVEGFHRCSSLKLSHGPNGVQDELCFNCYLRDHEPSGVIEQPVVKRTVCINLGEATGDRRECGSCRGTVLIKLMSCSVHGECTTYKKLDGVACCQGCVDYSGKQE